MATVVFGGTMLLGQFSLHQLPPDISHSARRRIAEYLAGKPKAKAGIW